MAACFLECVDHIEYAVAFAGSEVVNGNALVVSQFLDSFYMAACQVNNMDVIADKMCIRDSLFLLKKAEYHWMPGSSLPDERYLLQMSSARGIRVFRSCRPLLLPAQHMHDRPRRLRREHLLRSCRPR